jgi:hypothetical protein
MKKTIALSLLLFLSACAFAQNRMPRRRTGSAAELKIPMLAERWEFTSGKVEFITHKSVPALKVLPDAGKVVLKDLIFSNGTIEFDVENVAGPFCGIYFRQTDDKEGEFVYLRTARAGNIYANDALQYAPIVNGVNLWDLFDQYQAPAMIKKNDSNHIKLIVSGFQMRVYVNDMLKPALEIPRLEGNSKQGAISFDGQLILSNLIVRPNEVEGLSANEGVDLTNHNANFIRQFMISLPVELPSGKELTKDDLPQTNTSFESILSERAGLINITRKYGESKQRRYIWLKAKINSDKEQTVQMRLGFSDEVWVFVNNRLTYIDKNLYRDNFRKYPDGRISIENSQFPIRFTAGENEILIGVSNNFFGWGIIARLESMEGLSFSKL